MLDDSDRRLTRARCAAQTLGISSEQCSSLVKIAYKTSEQTQGEGLQGNLFMCSPLAVGIDLIVQQANLPAEVKTAVQGKFGPGNVFCEYSICAANLLCPNEAAPAISAVNSQRQSMSKAALTCADYETVAPTPAPTPPTKPPTPPPVMMPMVGDQNPDKQGGEDPQIVTGSDASMVAMSGAAVVVALAGRL